MFKVRVIPCLDVKDGRVVKGVRFVDLRDAGDPVAAAIAYDAAGADELTFLDITASHENRDIILDVVRRTAEACFMPLTVGGGVRTVEDIRKLLASGADKVSINTAAVARRAFVKEAAEKFGDQCIVVAIDAKRVSKPNERERWEIFTHGGRNPTGLDAVDYAREVVALGAGEILLTSMDRDGTKQGFDIAVHGGQQDLAGAERDHLARVIDRVEPGGIAAAVGEDLPARAFPRLRHALGIDRNHDALVAEFLRRLLDEGAPGDRRGIDRHLVGARSEKLADVLDGAHPAADGERHEAGFGGAPHHVEDDVAVLVAGGDVEERELVGAGGVIGDRRRNRIAGVAQIDEFHAFDDTAVLDVEAGNDANLEHGVTSPRAPRGSTATLASGRAGRRRARGRRWRRRASSRTAATAPPRRQSRRARRRRSPGCSPSRRAQWRRRG